MEVYVAVVETGTYPTEILGVFTTRELANTELKKFQSCASYEVLDSNMRVCKRLLNTPIYSAPE